MYSLKGFVSITGLVDNTVGVTATIGELSTFSNTFTKEQGTYCSIQYPNILLTTFTSKKDGALVPVAAIDQVNTFLVAGTVYNGVSTKTYTNDRALFLQDLIATIGDSYTNVDCGEMINSGDYYCPEWVSWTPKDTSDFFKLWFVDQSFQAQFDDYEIIVIPPFTPIDNFFGSGSVVDGALQQVTATSMVQAMEAAKANYPESYITVEEYNYINPAKTSGYIASKWGIIIYGNAGNNDDLIRDAIISYILANSTHSQTEWTVILPDLFKKTEFYIVPFYDQYAIPNRTLQAGIYSPILTAKRMYAVTEKACYGYAESHVSDHLTIFAHTYKSLILTAVGGPTNRNGKYMLTDYYPDYIAVETSSTDFNRMSVGTQRWAIQIAELLQKAEDLTSVSQVPAGMSRITRGNYVYLAKSIDNVEYLVLAKSNYPAISA